MTLPIAERVEVPVLVHRFELRYDMNKESLEHLAHNLVRALDENLLRPPVSLSHVIQQPLKIHTHKKIQLE